MEFVASTSNAGAAIPVVDMGPLRDNSNPGKVANAIHDANRSLGFLYVSNHGLSSRLMDETRQAGLGFFRQPESAKREVRINDAHRGYLGYGGATMYGAPWPTSKKVLFGVQSEPRPLQIASP